MTKPVEGIDWSRPTLLVGTATCSRGGRQTCTTSQRSDRRWGRSTRHRVTAPGGRRRPSWSRYPIVPSSGLSRMRRADASTGRGSARLPSALFGRSGAVVRCDRCGGTASVRSGRNFLCTTCAALSA